MGSQIARSTVWAAIAMLGLISASQASAQASETTTTKTAAVRSVAKAAKDDVQRDIRSWSTASQSAAHQMIDKYGLPDEATPSMLVWFNNGDWKRTIVHRDVYTHNFPQPHHDIVEQVINYQVPSDKLFDLDRFDGSLSFNRTRGELTSWAETEQDNVTALNLADDIVHGRQDVNGARQSMARTQALSQSGKTVNSKPNWSPGNDRYADPDSSTRFNESGEQSPAWP